MTEIVQYLPGRNIRSVNEAMVEHTRANLEKRARRPGWPAWACALTRGTDGSGALTLYVGDKVLPVRPGQYIVRDPDGGITVEDHKDFPGAVVHDNEPQRP